MANLWTLGGLSVRDVLHRTARESWKDAVFGHGGRMAFYHFLAIFPSLLLFFAIGSLIPHLSEHIKYVLQTLSSQVLPGRVSQLLKEMMNELNGQTGSGARLIPACAGALWASLNGTWAMIYGLNQAYEVEEHRSWWELAVTIVGLTLSLAISGSVAIFLIFFGARLEAHLYPAAIPLRVLQWVVLSVLLMVSFSLLYRFGPNLRDHEWRWSTPGALCALVLWIGSTLAVRLYFDHVNNYSRNYGQLNGVVMLLLWLYVTNGAILIGGEMNSEIEKAAVERVKGLGQGLPEQNRSGS
jgi:membrane protein